MVPWIKWLVCASCFGGVGAQARTAFRVTRILSPAGYESIEVNCEASSCRIERKGQRTASVTVPQSRVEPIFNRLALDLDAKPVVSGTTGKGNDLEWEFHWRDRSWKGAEARESVLERRSRPSHIDGIYSAEVKIGRELSGL